jgi:NADH:ubiquinone oxidoreductase subunit F (NADH-binding)
MSTAGIPATAGAAPPGLPRLIQPDSPLGLAGHLDRYGPVPFGPAVPAGQAAAQAGEWLIAAAEQAGLRGRGGAGFPAAAKMRAVLAASGRSGSWRAGGGTVLLANGAESEPSSRKDRTLLHRAPHLVLDGIALAAQAVGASRAQLCLHTGHDQLRGELAEAITARERAGLNRVPVQLTAVAGGYVSGQETALISQLNGGPGKPAFVPPRPSERGVGGRPTLVLNVETLAHLALIARYGPGWFGAAGGGLGSALITVGGAVTRPGVYEIALGTPLADLIGWAGGPAEAPQAILAGGFFGGWLRYDDALSVPVSDPALRAVGAALGPGVIVVLPQSACGLAETARALGYLAGQSANQCGPCYRGLPALADSFWQLAYGRADRDSRAAAATLLPLVARRGACHLPDGTASLAASALGVFGPELDRHAAYGPCPRVTRPGVLTLPPPPGWPAGPGRPA